MSSWAPTQYKTTNWSAYSERFTPLVRVTPRTYSNGRDRFRFGLIQRSPNDHRQTASMVARNGASGARHIGIDEGKEDQERPQWSISPAAWSVRAVQLTGNNIGDAPVLPELLEQTSTDQRIGSVTADGTYDTQNCHEAITAHGAAAVIPPRENTKLWKPTSPGAVARNEALRASKSQERAIWRRWSGHRPSRVETKMNCIKLLGQSLMARDFNRQVAAL